MLKMFTTAMKGEPLHSCYKQIFPLLATEVNGLKRKKVYNTHRRELQDLCVCACVCMRVCVGGFNESNTHEKINCIITHGIY